MTALRHLESGSSLECFCTKFEEIAFETESLNYSEMYKFGISKASESLLNCRGRVFLFPKELLNGKRTPRTVREARSGCAQTKKRPKF